MVPFIHGIIIKIMRRDSKRKQTINTDIINRNYSDVILLIMMIYDLILNIYNGFISLQSFLPTSCCLTRGRGCFDDGVTEEKMEAGAGRQYG